MRVTKASEGSGGAPIAQGDLERINAMARRTLGEEEVYTFSLRLCDNEVDRDFERFTPRTLEELAERFVGKSGIFDHQWSARGQAARIYKTEVVRQPERLTRAGDGYCWLKGYAYMMRTDSNRDLICEIEGGIKKEVSVGCAVERSVCSICGADLRQGQCGHKKGEVYDGRLCYASLEGASDAYEFSFVAVPAQPGAGVVKGRQAGGVHWKEAARQNPDWAGELKELEEEAALGRAYLKQLREEAVRLGLLAGTGLDRAALERLISRLSREELIPLKEAWGARAAARYPIQTQLDYENRGQSREEPDGAFLI